MKAEELRIGNWVEHNDEWCYRGEDVYQFQWDDSDWYALGESIMFIENINPIPLTEQWLIDFGFKKVIGFYIGIYPDANLELGYNNDKSYPQWYCFIRNILDDGNIDEFCIFRKDLRYVHQLQNLYFALTGEELQL